MNKKFLPYFAVMGAGSASASMFYRGQRALNDDGSGFTDEQLKAQAEANIKRIAEKAATEAMPKAFEANMSTAEAKAFMKAAIAEALKDAEIDDEATGTKKTIAQTLKEFQDQHNVLAKAFKDGQGSASKVGSYVSFVQKNIAENKAIDKDASYRREMSIKAAELMTTANVKPSVVGGFSPLFGNFIDTEIGHVPKPENVILPLINVKVQPGTESIWYTDRVNEQGDAEFIGEGTLKPLISADYQTSKEPVKEVAVRWKFTKRLMNHAPSVVSDFLEHAVELMDSKVDDGALDGDGTGNNLAGIASKAAAFIVPTQLAGYFYMANIFDVINSMAAGIRLKNFKGQITAILNTVWETKFMGLKTTDGAYLTPDFVSPDGKKVGSVNIVFSNKVDDTKIIVGDLKRFNLVWAEMVEYDEGYENDDFSKNLVSRKLEAFIGTYMKESDAGSIVMDDIATVLTAIDKPIEP